jgi:hypothetical protein
LERNEVEEQPELLFIGRHLAACDDAADYWRGFAFEFRELVLVLVRVLVFRQVVRPIEIALESDRLWRSFSPASVLPENDVENAVFVREVFEVKNWREVVPVLCLLFLLRFTHSRIVTVLRVGLRPILFEVAQEYGYAPAPKFKGALREDSALGPELAKITKPIKGQGGFQTVLRRI